MFHIVRQKHHSDEFSEQLASDVSAALAEGKELYLLGDYNINLFSQREKMKIETFCRNLDLYTVNTKIPTRVEGSSASLIDHFFCSSPHDFETKMVDSNFPTDHYLAMYMSKFKHKNKVTFKWCFNKRNYSKTRFSNEISETNWSSIYNQTDANDMLQEFNNIVETIIAYHAPFQKCYVRNIRPKNTYAQKPWIDDSCKELIDEKKIAFRNYKNMASIDNFAKYKRLRNMVNRKLKVQHEEFVKHEFSDLQCHKKRWQFINKIRGTLKSRDEIPVLRNSFGNLIINKKEICNLLNVVFSGLGKLQG